MNIILFTEQRFLAGELDATIHSDIVKDKKKIIRSLLIAKLFIWEALRYTALSC